ncbi:hypothetical protein [Alkalihalobacillus sp. CinArs1]|nr:hypothetical protein [Alkalihalobacillus sp. CinArs1]
MGKNSKQKQRMARAGADRAVAHDDPRDLTSMSSQERKKVEQERLSGGE